MAEWVLETGKILESEQKCSVLFKQNSELYSSGSSKDRILQLQRTAGNQAVQRLIKSGSLQAKLRIGQPNDIYEQEADRVAEQVMRMPEPQVSNEMKIPKKTTANNIQRKCPGCKLKKDEEEKILQAKEISGSTPEVTPELESSISAVRGGGQPLPESTRAFFEPRFGHDFSRVRVHTGSQAINLARSINAQAFTIGQDMVFGAGQYGPETTMGQKLLAHELTHVVQQNNKVQTMLVQRSPTCKNDVQVDEILAGKKNKRNDYEKVTMYKHEIKKGESYGKLAEQISADNEVTDGELEKELKTLNKGISLKTDMCVVLIKGWTSPKRRQNRLQIDKILAGKKNNRMYPKEVTMYEYQIKKGESLRKLTEQTLGKNKVVSADDLGTELKILNNSIEIKAGLSVVLIEGWTSPKWQKREKRINCGERIEKFKQEKKYSEWEQETVQEKDNYEKIVDRVHSRRPNLYKGRAGVYVKYVSDLNKTWIGPLNEGECVALPVGWKDPNIGELPKKPTSETLSGDVAKAVATVYAEQTGTTDSAQEQQKYIWFSIRKRVETEVRGPNLNKVLTPEYHGINTPDYKKAIEDLKKPKPSLDGVVNAKRIVLENWLNSLPNDAGAFYFHWRENSTPDNCYGKPKKGTEEEKEKECAWKWASALGFAGSITKSEGWLKRIRGNSSSPKERIGSMYIYP